MGGAEDRGSGIGEAVAAALITVVVSAYDDESYVVWELS
jgi:hypothetical protein